jgi:hypothetical protein
MSAEHFYSSAKYFEVALLRLLLLLLIKDAPSHFSVFSIEL